jgi:hypothetical protein
VFEIKAIFNSIAKKFIITTRYASINMIGLIAGSTKLQSTICPIHARNKEIQHMTSQAITTYQGDTI